MGGEWRTLSLRDAGVTLLDCDHRTPAEARTGFPYVTIPQMRDGELDVRAARLISPSDFVEWTKKTQPLPFDVLLSRRCNPGETAHVRDGQVFAVGQNLVLLRADGRIVTPSYLRWMTKGPAWWLQVEKYRNPGAVFDSLKCRDIIRFELPIPPLSIQYAISDILSALDDKIELNRRMADTLEPMARALFKSWFVDFGPVHAKIEGRPTGLAADISALFPDRFDNDGLPAGWSTRPFSDLFGINGGNTPRTDNERFWGGPHQWATPKDLSRLAAPVLLQTGRQLTDAGLSQASSGLLPAGTLLLSTRAPIGYLAFIVRPTAINQGFAGIVRKKVSTAYAWAWCHANMDVITGNAGGSTFPEISKAVLRQLPILAPPQPVLDAFGVIADTLIEQVIATTKEAQTLAILRDTLLPKLISGELRIGETEREFSAA